MEPEAEAFLKKIGIRSYDEAMLDVDPPVQVDEDRLRAFHRGELDRKEEQEILFLVTHYRKWYEADCNLMQPESGSGE